MSLSTAQIRVLREVKQSNDAGRGLIPPNGPGSRPFKFLVNAGYLSRKPGEALHYVTSEGRTALERAESGSKSPA